VGAASPIPATAVFLFKFLYQKTLRISLLHKRSGNAFTEGSRELFDLAGQGRIDLFFLGGAQIDGEANINLVQAEGKRFPGSFGSAFMYFTAGRTILFREEHSRRVLVQKVEFISAPGWSPPGVERRGWPQALLTGKALFSWQKGKRRFRLESAHPGHSLQEIREQTGFSFDASDQVPETPSPSTAELEVIRTKVKPEIAANYPEFAARVWPGS
jgi:glutaconate CoA-transferase subunit B